MYIYTHTYVRMCGDICMYVCAHTYIYIYVHTHGHFLFPSQEKRNTVILFIFIFHFLFFLFIQCFLLKGPSNFSLLVTNYFEIGV